MKLALDSNVFIAYLQRDDAFFDSAKKLLEDIESKRYKIVFSTLTFGEVMYGAPPNGSLEIVKSFFNDMLGAVAVAADEEVCLLAAELRLKHSSLKLPDAIHLATALVSSADRLITADKKLYTFASNEIKCELLRPTPGK